MYWLCLQPASLSTASNTLQQRKYTPDFAITTRVNSSATSISSINMAIDDIAAKYFTYEARLASFQPVAKRSIKWPHNSLAPEEFARAGFFYHPTQANPDNCACFLCHRSMDGWEEDDNPLAEHLKHSPDCGWAIVTSIADQVEELSQEYPASDRMIDARRATFGDKWPHEGKKGWKCKVKQVSQLEIVARSVLIFIEVGGCWMEIYTYPRV